MANPISRRSCLKAGLAATAPFVTGLTGGAAAVQASEQVSQSQTRKVSGMKITGVDCFRVVVPWPDDEIRRGKLNQYGAVRITTTDGITGYAFNTWGNVPWNVDTRKTVHTILLGKDPFAVEEFLSLGLGRLALIEFALWDIIGKAAGQPVHKLLGGSKERTKYYLTMVWEGEADQSHLDPEKQAEDILRYNQLGYKAVKIRAWRKDIMKDVEVARHVMQSATPGFRLMFDRTAEMPGWVWTYEQAYQVAKGLQEAGAYWLEEPFEVGDIDKSAKLTGSLDMLISGGEHDYDINPFAGYLGHNAFDVVNPDCVTAGGILTIKKIGALAQAFRKPCILHGTHSLSLFPWLQANASLLNCEYQEIGLIKPPILPNEQWEPGTKLLKTKSMFAFDTDYLTIPQGPGLGMDVDEDAVNEYRID